MRTYYKPGSTREFMLSLTYIYIFKTASNTLNIFFEEVEFLPHFGYVIKMTSSSRVFIFRIASRWDLASLARGGNGGKQQPSMCTSSSKGIVKFQLALYTTI